MASYGPHGSSFVRLPEPRPTPRRNACWSRPKVEFYGGRFTKCRCSAASGIVSDGCSNFKNRPTPHICRAIPISFRRSSVFPPRGSFLSNLIFVLAKKHCTVEPMIIAYSEASDLCRVSFG